MNKQTIFTEQIIEIEKAYNHRLEKPLLYEAENLDLRNKIRQFCKENGIDEVGK